MANKNLFATASKAKSANVINEAGGRAYAFSAEHALAQYAATGTFNSTFYATADEQLTKVLELAAQVDPVFLAKTAVFARERGYMKDLPAFLAAVLASKDVNLLAAIFPRVIDNAKMLRNFTQIVRSGVTGRKSFGSAPKRLARAWFSTRSAENVFRASVGNDPSLADVIKLVRPVPKNDQGETDVMRQALYGWLIGREVDATQLPPLVRSFEAFKKGESKDLPDVPFEMLAGRESKRPPRNPVVEFTYCSVDAVHGGRSAGRREGRASQVRRRRRILTFATHLWEEPCSAT